jgi:hypothetical protein
MCEWGGGGEKSSKSADSKSVGSEDLSLLSHTLKGATGRVVIVVISPFYSSTGFQTNRLHSIVHICHTGPLCFLAPKMDMCLVVVMLWHIHLLFKCPVRPVSHLRRTEQICTTFCNDRTWVNLVVYDSVLGHMCVLFSPGNDESSNTRSPDIERKRSYTKTQVRHNIRSI